MSTDDPFGASAAELGRMVRSRKITSEALTRGYLDRLRSFGKRLNAVVTLTDDLALEQARQADQDIRRGRVHSPLHGVPWGAKDLLATRGIPTSWGAEPYREQVIDTDATVVRRLRAAGTVLVAKLAMVELAGGLGYDEADASFTGPGLCPWNTDYWSGGSSSGPGAAVSAGLVGFAIGSETSGSILTPSAFCGVTGLRPTYGRVSRHGAMALCWTLDKLGPMCRSVEDCALVLQIIAGPDPHDATAVDRPYTWRRPRGRARRLRIGVPKGCTEKVQPAVRENFEAALQIFTRFAEIEPEVEWPDYPWGAVVGTIVDAEGAAAFLPLLQSGDVGKLRCPADRIGGYPALLTPAVDYVQAMRIRAPMQRAVNALFRRYDMIASPTRATVSYPTAKKFRDAYPDVSAGPALIPAGNLCGLPAVCFPNGFGSNNLPTSMALLGPAFSEEVLLGAAYRYQQSTRWHLLRPPIG